MSLLQSIRYILILQDVFQGVCNDCRQCSKHHFLIFILILPTVRDVVRVMSCSRLLSFLPLERLRGAAIESCVKAIAVGQHRKVPPQIPRQYYVKYDNGRQELRSDPQILREMWLLAQKIVKALKSRQIFLKWAQSTYHNTAMQDEATEKNGGYDTRSRRSFTVDLVVVCNGRTIWLEYKYTETSAWGNIVREANKSVKFWERVVKEPSAWKLDANLGGGPLLVPDALGTLVSNTVAFQLAVKGGEFVSAGFEMVAPKRKPRPDTRPAADKARRRSQLLRKRNRQSVETGQLVLKRPSTNKSSRRSGREVALDGKLEPLVYSCLWNGGTTRFRMYCRRTLHMAFIKQDTQVCLHTLFYDSCVHMLRPACC